MAYRAIILLVLVCIPLALVWSLLHPQRVSPRWPAGTPAPRHVEPADADRFWRLAEKESDADKVIVPQLLRHARQDEPASPWRKIMHGSEARKTVALTFDDGPHPKTTLALMAILRRYGIHATFFVVGKMAERYPELVRAEYRFGHIIGNHTFHHLNLTHVPPRDILTEWLACNLVVKSIIGIDPAFCRPPGGDVNANVIHAAQAAHMTTVLWSADPADYANPGEEVIINRILARLGNGGIILLHDGPPQTVAMLPRLIEILESRGYTFQTIPELARDAVLE